MSSPQPTEAQMKAARDVVRQNFNLRKIIDPERYAEIIAAAIATAHREGVDAERKRCAEVIQQTIDLANLVFKAGAGPITASPIFEMIKKGILSEANPDQMEGNGLHLPVETATEERTACLSRPDPSEKPGSSSGPVTAAPGANPSQALGAPVEPGAAGANATAASFSGRE